MSRPKAERSTDRPIFKKSPAGHLWYSVITGVWCHETESNKYLAADIGNRLGWALALNVDCQDTLVFDTLTRAMRFVDAELAGILA